MGRYDDKVSVGGGFSLDFNFKDEEGREKLAGTTEPVEDETSTLNPPLAFKSDSITFYESPRRRQIEYAAQTCSPGDK